VTGDELKAMLEKAGLRQCDLAAALGVSQVTVWRWIVGQRSITPLAEIAIRHVLGESAKRRRKRSN